MNKEDYFKYYIQGSDHYLIPKDVFNELFNEMENWKEEAKELQKQLEYLRSGEYYNQLRFERDMLQYVADNGKVSKEDKEFIDMTHRNTELLEVIEEVREYIEKYRYITDKVTDEDSLYYGQDITMYAFNDDNVMELLQILDKVKD